MPLAAAEAQPYVFVTSRQVDSCHHESSAKTTLMGHSEGNFWC